MRSTILATAAITAVVLTGCSDGDPGDGGDTAREGTESSTAPTEDSGDSDAFVGQEPDAIAQAAKDAMAGLQSVRVAGSITNDGQEMSIDLALSNEGDCSGSFTIDGGTVSLVGTGGQVWFQGDDAFWQSSSGEQASTIIDLIDGRWVVVAPTDDSFDQFCHLDSLLEEMVESNDEDTYEKGDVTDIDGSEAIGIVNTTQDGGPSTGYVQVEGDHYLLQIVREEGEEPSDVSFSAFDEPVVAKAPAPEDTVDLDELGG